MADEARARDQYERYYAEKIWASIPEFYRSEDAEGANPNAFRELVEVLAEQAAVTRRSIDRLWEDQHIETSDDWAVPYLGDLLAVRLLSERDPRARRVDVARTVHYRRRRGTPSLLEALVREISGWDTVLVEAFKRLARTPHRLDALPAPRGRITRTPAGGLADLRDPRASDLQPGPFDEFSHTPDVRQLRGHHGRFNVSKLNFHLFRVRPFPVEGATPVQLQDSGPVTFTVDPSGRDIQLFSIGVPVNSGSLKSCGPPWSELPTSEAQASELDDCELRCLSSEEWEIARPIPCRALSDAAFFLEAEDVAGARANGAPEAIEVLIGWRFENEARLRARLEQVLEQSFALAQPVWYHELLRNAATPDSAKRQLLPLNDGSGEDGLAGSALSLNLFFDEGGTAEAYPFDQVSGADLSSRQCHPVPADIGIRLLVHPELGRFAYPQVQIAPPEAPDPFPNPDPEDGPIIVEDPPPETPPAPPPPPTITSSSLSIAGNEYTLSFEAPENVEAHRIVLFADGDTSTGSALTVGAGASVGAFGASLNLSAGNDPTTIGPDATVGDVWTNGAVALEDGTRVSGSVRTSAGSGSITEGTGVVVTGDLETGVALNLQAIDPADLNLTPVIEFATTGLTDVTVLLAEVVSLDPTVDYGTVTVESGGTLRLGPGDYRLTNLDLQPNSTLQLDAGHAMPADARIQLNVEATLVWEGRQLFLWGSAGAFTLVYVGTDELRLSVAFAGRVFAPRAQLVLNAPPTGGHTGQFFAGSVVAGPGAAVQGFGATAEANLYVYGFAGELGAGTYSRELPKPGTTPPMDVVLNTPATAIPASGALTLGDNRTYRLTVSVSMNHVVDAALQSNDGRRPYVLLEGGEAVVDPNAFPKPAARLFPESPANPAQPEPRSFAVSGVWLGSLDSSKVDWVIERATAPATNGFDWGEIVIRHATLDPGGTRADTLPIAPLRLFVAGRVERLVIERSIVAPIIVDPDSDDARIETLVIRDSIVDARQSPLINDRATAISNPLGRVELSGVTVLGDVRANVLEASDSIVMGRLIVANTQDSCFRFSATSLGDAPLEEEEEDEAAAPRLPKLFRVPPIQQIEPFFFSSLRFGDPGYAQLSRAAPEELREGAESTSEMGAFSFLFRAIKLGSIVAKVDEFKPVAALPQVILENESVLVCEPST